MNDERVWAFERSLWVGGADQYRKLVDDDCLMVLPQPPHVMGGAQAIGAVAATPRWTHAELSQRRVSRPQDGMIVLAYEVEARKDDGRAYRAHCTSTYRRLAHDEWRVVQHQQTPPVALVSAT